MVLNLKRTINRALCLLLALYILVPHYTKADHLAQQNVLVLHSYDASYEWTRMFQQGIQHAIDSASHPIHISVEYFDTKRLYSDQYYHSLAQYLESKYANYPIDGILVTDDNALNWLNSLDSPTFSNLPIVAAGIGNRVASLNPTTDQGTILYEIDHVKDNLALIVKLRPNIKRLYYLADYSYSSMLLRGWVLDELENYPELELVEIRDLSLDQATDFVSTISSSDAVLLTHFNTEVSADNPHSYTRTAVELSKASKAPIFVFWGFYLKGDILGGYVNHSYYLGVEIVKRLGEKLNNPILLESHIEQDASATLQYKAITKYSIDQSLLPENTNIIGKPISFWSKHKKSLLIFGSIIGILLLIILLLSFLLNRKRELNKKNKKIVKLQEQMLTVQKNLIHILGEAIETRSGETGNHVRRVAKLSAHLARLYGLSSKDCDIIEIISPMHDVGKVAIPEAILEKPGKLTKDEWAIMQQHTITGYRLLKTEEEGDIMNLAAIISLEHHERWDGNGYPHNKSKDDIHIFARITTIADVFDALCSKRVYKEAWTLAEVSQYFQENSGKQFDPNLTHILLNNITDFVSIRQAYPD